MSQVLGQPGITSVERPATRSDVTVLQIVVVATYAIAFATSDAPAPFSLADWLFMFVPPVVFALCAWLGQAVCVPVSTSMRRRLSAFGNILAVCALLGTVALIPVWILFSALDGL